MKRSIAFSLRLVTMVIPCPAPPFMNLGFDSANTKNVSQGGRGFTSDLLPGWTLAVQGSPANVIGLNLVSAGINQYSTLFDATSGPAVEGKFSLGLYAGLDPFTAMEFFPLSISQVGQIPPDAKTLQYLTYALPLELRVNDILIPLEFDYSRFPSNDPVQRTGDATGDISTFAGQTVELKFTTLRVGIHGIDSISFSTEVIPEPSTWALFGLAAFGFLGRFVCRRIAA